MVQWLHAGRSFAVGQAAMAVLSLGAPLSRAEVPPAPHYIVQGGSIGISSPPMEFSWQGKRYVEATWASYSFSNPVPGGPPMSCPATAAAMDDSWFIGWPTGYRDSYQTAPAPVAVQQPVCTAYPPGGGSCLASACAHSGVWNYTMYGRCSSFELHFRERPNRCVCPWSTQTWVTSHSRCAPVVEVDLTRARPRACVGNPLSPLTGRKVQQLDLGTALGAWPLRLHYDSASLLPANPAEPAADSPVRPALAGFGPLWSGSFHRTARTHTGLAGSNGVMFARGDGSWTSFVRSSTGSWVSADPRVADKVVGTTYHDRESQAIETYDGSTDRLTAVAFAAGGGLSLHYASVPGGPEVGPTGSLLVRVRDSVGRELRFEYEATPEGAARVKAVVQPDGARVQLAYGPQGMLSVVTWPDLTTRRFVYEHPSQPAALTGIVGESETLLSSFGYDEQGRAISSASPDGVNAFAVTYSEPSFVRVREVYDAAANIVRRERTWLVPSQITVTDPSGTASAWIPDPATPEGLALKHQPAGSGCDASTRASLFDTRGNVVRRDDFNGHRGCFVHDSANRETVRVEGLASTDCEAVLADGVALPEGSRKVSTRWHAAWKLKTAVAAPGRLTTYVYNGQADPFNGGTVASCAPGSARLPDGQPIAVLCKQVEQATTDLTGALGLAAIVDTAVPARTQSWTYDGAGRTLTSTDALLRTTTFAYHATTSFVGTGPEATGHHVGDLSAMTNAAGHVTRFPLYDKAGRWLRMEDPNGVVTQRTFDSRGRLQRVDTAGASTSLEYWPTGLLKRVRQPDGSHMNHEYDTAQRLIAVSDSLGNRVDYLLDNAGHRLAERVQDSSGVLRRSLLRSFDALGRVQQVTGRE